MITYLIEALQAAGLTPTAEELADLLWLASQMGTPTFVKAETALEKRQAQPVPTLSHLDNTKPVEDDRKELEQNTQASADVYLPPIGSQNGDEVGSGGLPFHSPGATGLPGALDIGRALRPFKRRVPARTQFVLDEEATVRRIVDMAMDTWLPVMCPAPARWLDVVLVVDESSSMVLWRQTTAEFRRLLEQLGAFRTIQTWYMLSDVATGQVSLGPDLRTSKAGIDQRSAAELNDPRGRRLILVLSDCVAPYWYSGEITDWLARWGQEGLVAIVHMLPQQLRLRTGLASAAAVHVCGHLPGLRNAQLEIEWPRRRRRNQKLPTGIPIPVVTLEPETLAAWARLLAGNGKLWLPAVVFPKFQITDLHPNDIDRTDLSEQLPPEKQVEQFLATASPLARELAGYLAAVPLSLPVIRLVQRVMLPQSRQVHLAEVLLSGLIKQEQVYDLTMHSDDIRYDFLDGVRDLLLDTTLISNTIGVLSLVSKFVDEQTGKPLDFQALIIDPTLAYRINLNKESRPFATLAIRILRRLGDKYSQLAQSLSQKFKDRTIDHRTSNRIVVLSQRNAMTPELHRQLRILLAELYPTRADLTRVAYDAGVPLALVVLGSSALNDWDAVLREATKQQSVDSLLDVVRQEYPNQPSLAEISATVAAHQRATVVASLPASNIHLLNFTRTLTLDQSTQLEIALGKRLGQIFNRPIEFDDTRPYGPQCIALADQVGLTKNQWETLPIVVNPPGFVPGALALFSELHGRMGYFPSVVRLRPVVGSMPRYEVAEIINLQALRDAARERGRT